MKRNYKKENTDRKLKRTKQVSEFTGLHKKYN